MISITWERAVEAEDVAGSEESGAWVRRSPSRQLSFGRWISIVAAAASLPLLVFQIAATTLSLDAHAVQTALKAFDAVLGVYLCVTLWRLWQRGFGLRPADTLIAWWTAFGASCCAISLLLPSWAGFPALLIGVSAGILFDLAFGIVLLRLKDDPYGCLNAYAFSHIALGVCIILSTMF